MKFQGPFHYFVSQLKIGKTGEFWLQPDENYISSPMVTWCTWCLTKSGRHPMGMPTWPRWVSNSVPICDSCSHVLQQHYTYDWTKSVLLVFLIAQEKSQDSCKKGIFGALRHLGSEHSDITAENCTKSHLLVLCMQEVLPYSPNLIRIKCRTW